MCITYKYTSYMLTFRQVNIFCDQGLILRKSDISRSLRPKKKVSGFSSPAWSPQTPPWSSLFFSFFPSAPRYPLEAVEFSCGSVMSDHIPNDSSEEHILSKVFVRKDINCLNPIEIPYYSSGIFPLICTNCAGDTDFVKGAQADAYYPICTGC